MMVQRDLFSYIGSVISKECGLIRLKEEFHGTWIKGTMTYIWNRTLVSQEVTCAQSECKIDENVKMVMPS